MALLFSACRETDGESSLVTYDTGLGRNSLIELAEILWIGIGRVNGCVIDHQKYINRRRRETGPARHFKKEVVPVE
jgi:hypothetical protein